ncbi:coiled-coil domain-containing protein 177 [Hippoglossus hippoglossus]|uniref:coiled-coil domain-containing protein 177 n=1 Tax=Hippoglossus hippoglossus TaxID=8267 RepID=UPI00148D224B|nr:coiled-coil domain-containing protein 177 [Hippoglossus hippoglossus]XP_034465692.1 coiled-coil domain-containing protein 177 [Hippoglossus hippoglossus]XP_034465693.1 coiled-coil domain-containing protein 177 [Hippoglossus hippoglossus]
MGEQRTTFPVLRLDLDNFDLAEAERSRYVLTSPRSLQSCSRLGIKPVELLIKSLNERIAEQRDVPLEAVRVMHESYERERTKLLQMCREERERIIQGRAGDRWPGLEEVPVAKVKDQSTQRHSIPYADLCLKGKPASRSSGSAAGPREPDRSTVCSYRLGDLRHSPATERKLERLTEDIRREMCVTVSERDRKIAALMLVKHEEEQARLEHCQQEKQEREEAQRQMEAQRAQVEKKRRRKLRQSVQCWHEDLEARRRLRERQEKEKVVQLKLEALLQEDRWRRLKEEVEAQRREKMEAAQKEAKGRKHYQEKLLREKQEVEKRVQEKERQVAVEKEQKARRSRELQEKKERKRLQEENHKELLRHILLKQEIEQRVGEEEAQMRSTLEKKLQHSCEKRAQAVEARLTELHGRAAREEEQVQRAQLRSKLQSVQQLTHKQILVQLNQRRMERAARYTSAQHRDRAQRTQQRNKHKQLCHRRLWERLQREEEAMRRLRESYIRMKEWRRERLRRQRDQIQEEAKTLARASFHLMDRARQLTHRRTFAQMALQAELTASMSHLKL